MRKHHLVYIQLGLIFIGLAILGYMAFLDGEIINPVLSKKNIHFDIVQKDYHAGDVVYARYDNVCKLRDISAKKFINIVDTVSIPYPVSNNSVPVGCYSKEDIFAIAKLPEFISQGDFMFSGYYEYRVNYLNTATYHFDTDLFHVK